MKLHSPNQSSSPKTRFVNFTLGHICFVLGLFLLVIGIQNVLLFQKVRWALRLSEKTHMFVINSFYYEYSKR